MAASAATMVANAASAIAMLAPSRRARGFSSRSNSTFMIGLRALDRAGSRFDREGPCSPFARIQDRGQAGFFPEARPAAPPAAPSRPNPARLQASLATSQLG